MELHCKHDIGSNRASLWQGDAKEFLGSMGAQTLDLIVTSPPYFLGKEYDVSRSIADFTAEIQRVLPEMIRALKPGGSLCWQVGNHVQDGCVTPLDAVVVSELRTAPLALKNRIIWTFNHGTHSSRRFSGRHETILWYVKSAPYHFDLDASRVPQLYPGKRHYKGPKKGAWSGNPLGKNPGDVWDIGDVWGIPNVKAKHIEKTEHPCQFPTALVRRLVVGLSPEAGLVADPYVGSGTTAVAALLENRNFVGSDLKIRYLDVADQRLAALGDGLLRVREDKPVRSPRTNESVARRPPHFPQLLEPARG